VIAPIGEAEGTVYASAIEQTIRDHGPGGRRRIPVSDGTDECELLFLMIVRMLHTELPKTGMPLRQSMLLIPGPWKRPQLS
jgi:hypothetical protein